MDSKFKSSGNPERGGSLLNRGGIRRIIKYGGLAAGGERRLTTRGESKAQCGEEKNRGTSGEDVAMEGDWVPLFAKE